MNNKFLNWLYYHPFYGKDKIHADGYRGIAESGVNLAVWGTVAGVTAHLCGAKRPVLIGGIVFGALILSEVLFQASGPSANGASLALQPTTAAIPSGSPKDRVNFATAEQGGFGEVEETGYTSA